MSTVQLISVVHFMDTACAPPEESITVCKETAAQRRRGNVSKDIFQHETVEGDFFEEVARQEDDVIEFGVLKEVRL